MRHTDHGKAADQGKTDSEDMVASKDTGMENTGMENTGMETTGMENTVIMVTIITIVVEKSSLVTITHVLRPSMGLMMRMMMSLTMSLKTRVTMIFHNRQGLDKPAMDVPTMKSWAWLRLWTKQRTWFNYILSSIADAGLSLNKAAKLARIKAHPDKNLRSDMSAGEKQRINDEAARIGQAADILTDPKKVSGYRFVR